MHNSQHAESHYSTLKPNVLFIELAELVGEKMMPDREAFTRGSTVGSFTAIVFGKLEAM